MSKPVVAATAAAIITGLGSCTQQPSRLDAIASSHDELASRCIDARPEGPWRRAELGLDKPRVTKSAGGLTIDCPFTLENGQKAVLPVVVVCPADTAVPCSSFARRSD